MSIQRYGNCTDICGQLFRGMGAELRDEQDGVTVSLHGCPGNGAKPVVCCVVQLGKVVTWNIQDFITLCDIELFDIFPYLHNAKVDSLNNLVLEGRAASQRVKPFLKPGPPGSQTAPSAEAETSGTVLSGGGGT